MLLSWWVPVITGLAAFFGVVIGQWLQGRRDKARWKQETERWQAEREDQRQRDRDAWAREDRFRFVEHRRELYAEILTNLMMFRGTLGGAILQMRRVLGNDPTAAEWKRIRESTPNAFTPENVYNLHLANARAKLVASKKVGQLSSTYITLLTQAAGRLVYGHEDDDAEALRTRLDDTDAYLSQVDLECIQAAMRADLGETPAPDELI